MIEISRAVFPSQEQLREAALGIRHSYNSEKYSDTPGVEIPQRSFGQADYELARKLTKAGERRSHCKFLRMMPVTFTINAPIYFYKELDTYHIGLTRNSSSTMHKIMTKPFEESDFSIDVFTADPYNVRYIPSSYLNEGELLKDLIDGLNSLRDAYLKEEDPNRKKAIWRLTIELLPESYMQLSTMHCNYETLHAIYLDRKDHKLSEWHQFCHWVEEAVPMSDLITGKDPKDDE